MILAIDQGTTGTTCLLVDEELNIRGRGYAELPQHYPQPGWVEHDPEEIWQSVLAARRAGADGDADGDRDHEPARDDAPLGPRAPASPCTTRSSGRTAARPSAARSCRPS